MARILWAFDILPKVDERTGEKIIPNPDRLTQGFVCMPEPFEAYIKPRSKERASIVVREWEETRKENLDEKLQWKMS